MDTSFLTLNSSGFDSGSNFLTDSCGRSTVLGGSFACSGVSSRLPLRYLSAFSIFSGFILSGYLMAYSVIRS